MKVFVVVALLASALSACTLGRADPGAGVAAGPADPALAGLPPGEGYDLLADVCTQCHDLGGVEAFKGYWDYDQWRDMVATMIDHGAELDAEQADVLAVYLTENFGPDAP